MSAARLRVEAAVSHTIWNISYENHSTRLVVGRHNALDVVTRYTMRGMRVRKCGREVSVWVFEGQR